MGYVCFSTSDTSDLPLPSWSACLGVADSAFTNVRWLMTPSGDRFFKEGYGDMDKPRRLAEFMRRGWSKDGLESVVSRWRLKDLVFTSEDGEPGDGLSTPPSMECPKDGDFRPHMPGTDEEPVPCSVHDGTFLSPLAEHLPEEVRRCYIRFVIPAGPVRGMVVHMAATAAEDFQPRQQDIAEPLAQYGIASLIVILPYYGRRRASGQVTFAPLTVEDFLLQNLILSLEGVALLRWLRRNYAWLPLGVTGVSAGGCTASVVSVLSRMHVACVPCLGSTSGAPLAYGGLSWLIDWDKLMEGSGQTLEEAKKLLEAELRQYGLEAVMDAAPDSSKTVCAMIQVSAKHDIVVPEEEGLGLYRVLQRACRRHTVLWVDGGHVTCFLQPDTIFVTAIVGAFREMELAQFRAEEGGCASWCRRFRRKRAARLL